MKDIIRLIGQKKNFVFLGESGSGKSEIAINFSLLLREKRGGTIHFFDMDMTKPLFRSRDIRDLLSKEDIWFHYEEQFADAPTMVGGVRACLKDPDSCVIMDVGGDYIGARAIGEYEGWLNRDNTVVYYVVNTYRPWSYDMEQIDRTLGEILSISHIRLDQIHIIANPNVGPDTKTEEVLEGWKRTEQLIRPYREIDFVCAQPCHVWKVEEAVGIPVLPVRLFLQLDELEE